MKVDVFASVKVKNGVAGVIKKAVSVEHFYRQERTVQLEILNRAAEELNALYSIETSVSVVSTDGRFSNYDSEAKAIEMGKMSMINFLNAYRAFMIDEGKVTEKISWEDSQAWSCKAFSLACPKSFEKSVKAGEVARFVWDEESDKALMTFADAEEEESGLEE